MGSFLRYNETLFQLFCNFKNNSNFSENREIWFFLIKIEKFVTKFRLNAYQNVFNCVYYICGSVGIYCDEWQWKKSKYLFKKKKKDLRLFLLAKKEKTYKKWFSHQPVRNGFLNRGPFAEVESTIGPLPLVRLIKSAVAPLLIFIWSP